LTQIGRGRRLRPVASQVLAQYGVVPAALKQITEASNTIFRVTTRSSDTYVLRLTAPKSCHDIADVRSEVAWLHALAEDTDIGVPAPVARMDGDYVGEVRIPGEVDAMCYALYRWVPGVMLADRLTEDNVKRMGTLMARLHDHAAAFEPSDGFRIRTYDSVFPYANESFPNVEPVVLFDDGQDASLTYDQRAVYHDAFQRVAEEVDRLMRGCDPLRVIHNDLHMWNVKVDGDRLYALDFEDMMWGHPIQDIATTMFYFRWSDTFHNMLAAFRFGYEAVGVWPEDRDGQLETLIMGRTLLLANYVAGSEDSEDRVAAPAYLERIEQRLRSYLLGLEPK
jgi:Ser/Thr protein kinase RdoA (MazF antagonist)